MVNPLLLLSLLMLLLLLLWLAGNNLRALVTIVRLNSLRLGKKALPTAQLTKTKQKYI